MKDLKYFRTWLARLISMHHKTISFGAVTWFTFETLSPSATEELSKLGDKYGLKEDTEWQLDDSSISFLMETLIQYKRNEETKETSENMQRLLDFIDDLLKLKLKVRSMSSMVTFYL